MERNNDALPENTHPYDRRHFFKISLEKLFWLFTGANVLTGVVGQCIRETRQKNVMDPIMYWGDILASVGADDKYTNMNTFTYINARLQHIYDSDREHSYVWNAVATPNERVQVLKEALRKLQKLQGESENVYQSIGREWETYANLPEGSLR